MQERHLSDHARKEVYPGWYMYYPPTMVYIPYYTLPGTPTVLPLWYPTPGMLTRRQAYRASSDTCRTDS